jgi:hypothetical protein
MLSIYVFLFFQDSCPGKIKIHLQVDAVFLVRQARLRTQHNYHHDTKVKPEAAIELLMMGGKMPETLRAVNKRQDNKLENCCIWLVII